MSTAEPAPQSSAPPGLGLSPATWAVAGGVAKWVGEKVAGAIVGKIVGELFSNVMDAIGMGGPDLVGKLDHISDQLVEVQRSLDRLTEMTAEILVQLAELRDFMEKSLKIETLIAAMSRIDVAYGSASSDAVLQEGATGRAISLRLLTEKMPHFDGITPEKLALAAHDFAGYVGDVPDCIATIRGVLSQAAFGQVSLLTYWARELSRQVKTGKVDREAAYLILEGYFLQAVSAQLKGVSVHCVALGTDTLGPQFIREYLHDNFAPIMASETAAFVEATELLVFSSLAPTMTANSGDGLGEREFPKHVDEILLRADLLRAALNLVGHKPDSAGRDAPSMQAAIGGIYGRVLLRPSDLVNGAPPAVTPNGYAADAGTAVRSVPLPCLDLVNSAGQAMLLDATSSAASYFWEFPSPGPAPGTPIDPRWRGGVTPAHYPVFGADQPPVLAASLLDVSRLYLGLPPGTPEHHRFNEFSVGSPDVNYYDQSCTVTRHPLTPGPGEASKRAFTVTNIYRANIAQRSSLDHALFSYAGGAMKVRLTAYFDTLLRRDPRLDIKRGTAFVQNYDVINVLSVRRGDAWDKIFYDSKNYFGPEHPVSVWAEPLSENWETWRRDASFSVDFDLIAGGHQLRLDCVAAFQEARFRFDGWQRCFLSFTLLGVSIERA